MFVLTFLVTFQAHISYAREFNFAKVMKPCFFVGSLGRPPKLNGLVFSRKDGEQK